MKNFSVMIFLAGFVVASAFAQSVKPRAGEYRFESSTDLHWVSIEAEGSDRYTIQIVSTKSGLSDGLRITGAYWRPGSGAIEFVYNGRTVQIRAESGGRAISCSLFGSAKLFRQ
jgi:hypothetical protein